MPITYNSDKNKKHGQTAPNKTTYDKDSIQHRANNRQYECKKHKKTIHPNNKTITHTHTRQTERRTHLEHIINAKQYEQEHATQSNNNNNKTHATQNMNTNAPDKSTHKPHTTTTHTNITKHNAKQGQNKTTQAHTQHNQTTTTTKHTHTKQHNQTTKIIKTTKRQQQ